MSNDTAKKAKEIFAKKLNYYMDINNVSQADIVLKFKLTASTVSDWCNAKKYPRVDKIQMLADFFGVLKSDLTEDKPSGIGENIIVYSRDGKTIERKVTKEQMEYIHKFISSISDDNVDL